MAYKLSAKAKTVKKKIDLKAAMTLAKKFCKNNKEKK